MRLQARGTKKIIFLLKPQVSSLTPISSGPAGESNPDLLVASQASSRWTSSPFCFMHCKSTASDPGWNRTIDFLDVTQASLPLDHGIVLVTGVRVELTNSRGSRPRRFTSLRTRPLQVRVLHPTDWAYEARLSTGSPASCFSVTKGRVELPRPMGDVLNVGCLPIFITWSFRCVIVGAEFDAGALESPTCS